MSAAPSRPSPTSRSRARHDHERFEYDAFGLLERAQNGATDRYYTYDAFGRRIAELHGKDGPQTVYGYAGADRVLRKHSP